jgi:Transposase DDE domain
MASIRKTRTASGAWAVQVVTYVNRRVVVLKHVGSAHGQVGVDELMEQALAWYEAQPAGALFPAMAKPSLTLEGTEFLGAWHTLAHSVLRQVMEHCGFDALAEPLLQDLAIMRLVEPTSKLRSLQLLDEYFGIHHSRRSFYRRLPLMADLKELAEQIAVNYAKDALGDGLNLVLYDVTTLYFETFTPDELRVPGFSKDNMAQQPQVVVGLLVTRTGFPLGFELFPGNTFEGKTMLPVLDAFIAKHKVSIPTVVADAAMLSQDLIKQIEERKMFYIVAARLAGSAKAVVEQVNAALGQQDGRTIRLPSPHGDMVCSFSAKRYKKDKHVLEKALEKAELLVGRGEPGKRAKFVKSKAKEGYVLDQDRIQRTRQLLGVKGYCTNIPEDRLDNASVIARYHDLWHVEKAFRMAKSDLATRPIFHFQQTAIRVHLLICFIALTVGRAIELRTGRSIRHVVDALWAVTDARLHHPATGQGAVIRSPIPGQAREILAALGLSY